MKEGTALKTLVCITLLFSGCRKDPGQGGSATIRGIVYAQNIHSKDTPVGADDFDASEKIYICYGDKQDYDDSYTTSSDGSFIFKYLRKGTYRIFAYSIDPQKQSYDGKNPASTLSKVVELGSNNDVVSVKDFILYKEANDGGSSTVCGKVYSAQSGTYISNMDVYITCGDEAPYFETKTKTNYAGAFEFVSLRKGKYTVSAYSKSLTEPATGSVEVTENNKVYKLNDIVVQ
jgi:hypothetical protein